MYNTFFIPNVWLPCQCIYNYFHSSVHLVSELETNLKLDVTVRELAVLNVEEKATTAFHSRLIYGLGMSRVKLELPLSSKNPKEH